MGKIAFVFSGQGAQSPGMGLALAAHSAAAKRVYEMAEALRPGTLAQLRDAGQAELNATVNAQPCLFCVGLAAAEALRSRGVAPDMVAGFSLGEIPALAFAGVLSAESAFRLVLARAGAMQACAEEHEGGMAAVLGLSNERVESICESVPGVYPANYNCPGQLVISGLKDALPAALKAVRAAGGRALPLNVSGAFHTPYMERAAAALAERLSGETLRAPAVHLYANATGEAYQPPYEHLIAGQVTSPVRFQTIIENMAARGVTAFIEVGVGRTLCGLIQKTIGDARTFAVTDPKSLEDAILFAHGECNA